MSQHRAEESKETIPWPVSMFVGTQARRNQPVQWQRESRVHLPLCWPLGWSSYWPLWSISSLGKWNWKPKPHGVPMWKCQPLGSVLSTRGESKGALLVPPLGAGETGPSNNWIRESPSSFWNSLQVMNSSVMRFNAEIGRFQVSTVEGSRFGEWVRDPPWALRIDQGKGLGCACRKIQSWVHLPTGWCRQVILSLYFLICKMGNTFLDHTVIV